MRVSGTYCPPYLPNRPFPTTLCLPCCGNERRDFVVVLYSRTLFDTACDIDCVWPDLPDSVLNIFRGEPPCENNRDSILLNCIESIRWIISFSTSMAFIDNHSVTIVRQGVAPPDYPDYSHTGIFLEFEWVGDLDGCRIKGNHSCQVIFGFSMAHCDSCYEWPDRIKYLPCLFWMNIPA